MAPVYRIRSAVAADIQSVADLARKTEEVPHWAIADYLAALTPAHPLQGAAATRRCFFVAETETSLAGFAVGRATVLEAEVLAELESVGVADSVRRAGIGRALCDAVIVWARGQGAAEIELEVRSRSDGAIALYRALRFAEVGTRKGYYREPVDDAVLMRLHLTSKSSKTQPPERDL